ncbi:MAG: transposase family protein, partial [Bacteroidetes bacterium]|nr:transposase family protein [Bacteroidota bacterium]
PPEIETDVVRLRDQHPAWGGRKLHTVLQRPFGERAPAASTITGILRRRGRLPPEPTARAYTRFEAEAPNDLWQMDCARARALKGDFLLGDATRCYPLTVTDDHSRFVLCFQACTDQRRKTVRDHLVCVFEHYGAPTSLLCHNGSPWGSVWCTEGAGRRRPRCTRLMAWLIRHGILRSTTRSPWQSEEGGTGGGHAQDAHHA